MRRKIVYEDNEVQAAVVHRVVRIKLVGVPAVYVSAQELADIADAVKQHLESAAEGLDQIMNEIDPLGQEGGYGPKTGF